MGIILLVTCMKENKISSINLLIIFFLSYSFYITQILTQQLFHEFNKQCVFIICIFQLLFPVTTYLVCKIINSNKIKENTKNRFAFHIISAIYLLVTVLISILNVTNIIVLYYYQETSYIILLIAITIPLIYTLIKGDHHFFSLSIILLIIYSTFKYSYLTNMSSMDFYVFYNILKIEKSNILLIIIYSAPILLEPLLLLNSKKIIANKINIKATLTFSILISLIGVLTILRQTWEYGELLNQIRFPYLESIKNIIAGKFFENIDFYYLLSLSVSIYIRLGYSFITIKNSLNLNKIITISLIFLLLILVFIVQRSMDLYLFSIDKILIISSTCLLLCFILLPLSIRRKHKHA